MCKKIIYHFIFLFNLIASLNLLGQVGAENIQLINKAEKILISFDIEQSKSSESYVISPSIFKAGGEKLNAISFNGDLHEVKGGEGKIIVWDALKDGYVLDENIYVELSIQTQVNVPVGSHVLKSAIMPGFGDYRIRNGKHYFLYSLLAYGSVAASVYFNQQAVQQYNSYRNSYDINQSNNLFKQAQQSQQISYAFAGAAALTWTINISSAYARSKKVKKSITPELSTYYYNRSKEAAKFQSDKIYINTKTPFDLAIDRGNKAFDEEKYQEALIAFEEAKQLKESEYVNSRISSANKMIAELKKRDDLYLEIVAEANQLFYKQNYAGAKSKFEEALQVKSLEKYPADKIAEIYEIQRKIERDLQYNKHIKEGDKLFSSGEYDFAITAFEYALNQIPNDTYAIGRIKECRDKIALNLKKQIDVEYAQLMLEGNNFAKSGRYEKALEKFEEAVELKPEETEPSRRISQCEEIIAKELQKKKEAEYRALIVKADAAYDNKQYDKAKDLYYEALQILPLESYPTNRIKSINEKLRVDTSNPAANLKELYKKCKPGVFLIYTEKFKSISQGSGFFITSDGIAVSNYHVYDGGYLTDALIMTEDERTYEIEKVLEKNKEKDYVIFKVKNRNKVNFPILKISNVNAEIGDNVFAIGNPKGLEKTLSNGIVSGIREDKNVKYIQTTAPITNGSSGGPLFNMKGEVIGITTMGLQDGSIFFALIINEIPFWKYVR